jgi:hypothetical protein
MGRIVDGRMDNYEAPPVQLKRLRELGWVTFMAA